MDETYPSIGALSDVLTDPEWASSKDKTKTAFARAHGSTMFEFFERDVSSAEPTASRDSPLSSDCSRRSKPPFLSRDPCD